MGPGFKSQHPHYFRVKSRFNHPADFEAVVRILPPEQGGRQTPPFNSIRWDFCYAEDDPENGIWMIWPDFVDERGNSLPEDRPLPVDVEIRAQFRIVDDKLREKFHRPRLREGTRFYCHEGPKRVAEGRVTQIMGLGDTRKV